MSKPNVARERFDAALAELLDGDTWRAWLETRAKFHRYSFGNVLLIAAQRPDATRVAGFKTWQSMGRQVRRGEKGIAIFAPAFYKPKDDHGTPIPDAEPMLYFRTVYVFDVAQTEGEELPEVARVLAGDSGLTDLADALAAHAMSEGLDVRREDTLNGSNGYIAREKREIVIHVELERDAAIKTLIHELAHWHDLGTDDVGDRDAAEIVAESVAFIVADAYGLDTSSYSVGYVAAWADGDLDKVKTLAERVDATARKLLDALDADLELADA